MTSNSSSSVNVGHRDKVRRGILCISSLLFAVVFLVGCPVEKFLQYQFAPIANTLGPLPPPIYLDPTSKYLGNATTANTEAAQDSSVGRAGLPQALAVRQPDCSLTAYIFSNYNSSTGGFTSSAIPNYNAHLHTLAGLTTNAGTYPKGCKDRTTGVVNTDTVVLGKTSSGKYLSVFIDANNNLYSATIDPAGSSSYTNLNLAGAFTMGAADLNGDGFNDLIVTAQSGSNTFATVLLNHGDGTFGVPVTIASGKIASVILDDFNGDGKVDAAVMFTVAGSGLPAPIQFFPGKGDGTFGAPIVSTVVGGNGGSTGDFNGDGKRDIVLTTGKVVLGNGDGTFTAATGSVAAGNPGPAVGDFNNDGKDDVAVDNGTQVSIFLGNGDGTFRTGIVYAAPYGIATVTVTDLDGDGNLDLLVGNGTGGVYGASSYSGGLFMALLGNGDGTFVGARSYSGVTTNMAHNAFATGDFNGDGNQDVLGATSTNTGFPGGLRLLLGDGQGGLTPQAAIPNVAASQIVAADVNGDKKLDAVAITAGFSGGYVSLAVLNGNGDGTFAAPAIYPVALYIGNVAAADLAVGDFRGSGKPDAVVAVDTNLYYFKNNGDGTFALPTQIDTQAGYQNMTTADLNGDGKADLIVTAGHINAGTAGLGKILVYLSHGDGTFAAPVNILTFDQGGQVAIGDVNNDGKQDILITTLDSTYSVGTLSVFLGKSDGTFAAPLATILQKAAAAGLAIGDADGDGKADVLIAGCCGTDYTTLALGNGDGTFKTNYALSIGAQSDAVSFVDLNNDGKPDVLIASGNTLVTSLNVYPKIVTATATTTALTASATNIAVGQSVTLTARVAATSGTTVPTGTVTFTDGTSTLSTVTLDGTGTATFSTSALVGGTHNITATYSGSSAFTASTSSPALVITVTVPPASTTTTVTSTSTAPVFGSSITLTATIAGMATGTATGTVTFKDGANTLGTGTLSAASATYTTTALAVGVHSITAVYGGDTVFSGSTSLVLTITVSAVVSPAFSVSISPSSLSIAQGKGGTATATVTPVGGYIGAITFTTSALPTGVSATFTPAKVTADGTNKVLTSSLSITTTAPHAMHGSSASSGSTFITFMATFVLGLLIAVRRRRSRLVPILAAACMFTLILGLSGCSDNSAFINPNATPPGSYSVTVTAGDGTTSKTAALSITVN